MVLWGEFFMFSFEKKKKILKLLKLKKTLTRKNIFDIF